MKISNNGLAIQYLDDEIVGLTNDDLLALSVYAEICMAAVQQNGFALKYIHSETLDKTNTNKFTDKLIDEIRLINCRSTKSAR
jgi:hypothetical protein